MADQVEPVRSVVSTEAEEVAPEVAAQGTDSDSSIPPPPGEDSPFAISPDQLDYLFRKAQAVPASGTSDAASLLHPIFQRLEIRQDLIPFEAATPDPVAPAPPDPEKVSLETLELISKCLKTHVRNGISDDEWIGSARTRIFGESNSLVLPKFQSPKKKRQKKPKSKVVVTRRATEREIKRTEVLVGDVVSIRAGDVVPADGVLIVAHGLRCDESLRTGQSEDTLLLKDAVKNPLLYAGCTVSEGEGNFLVLRIGDRTWLGGRSGGKKGKCVVS